MEDKITNPFPGLRPFEEEEEHLFFGRDNAVAELMSRLRTSRFLAVIGTSGSGKSSLIKAGLLPSLYRGFMSQAGSNWRVALFRPGDNPIGNLAEVLAGSGILYEAADDDDDRGANRNVIWRKFIETTLRRSNRGLIEVVKQARLPEHENLLIVVDQFEELFRFSKLERNSQDEKRDSTALVNLLLESAAQAQLPVYILLTMRSDFLGDCTEFRGLPETINKGQYLIPRMTRDEKRAAITGPVAVGGASITPTLLSRLLNDVGESPDQLPILQHAMMRTWTHWAAHHEKDEPLDLRHYEAIGTMKCALAEHAEEAYSELKTGKDQTICEKMFKLLTDRGEIGRGVRRPARIREICQVTNTSEKEVIKVVNVFRQPGRTFLMPPHEKKLDKDSVIDISHESLMRIWTRLLKWVEEEEHAAELYLRLAAAAALHEKGEVGLWRDPELMFALKWKQETEPNAVWANRYDPSFDRAFTFLEASKKQQEREIKEKEREQKAKIRRNRIFSTIISIIGIIAVFFAIWALRSKQEALEQQKIAEDASKIALHEKTIADKKRTEAEREKERAADSEKKAKEARKKAEESANAERMAKIEAEKNQVKAEKEERKAKENEIKEYIQALINDMNKEEANFRQYLAKAKELAVHSMSIAQTEGKAEEIKALLALTAFQINREAYKMLAQAAQETFIKFEEDTLDKFNRKKELVDTHKKLEKKYDDLLKKSKEKSVPEEIFEALRKAYIAKEDSQDILYPGPAESWALTAADGHNIVFNDRDGELFLASFKPNALKLPVINKKEITRLSGKIKMPQASAFAGTNEQLFCGTLTGSLIYWEKNNWKEKIAPGNHGAKILSMAFSKKKKCLFYSVKNIIYKHDLAGFGEPVITFEPYNFIRALTIIEEPGCSFLIAADSNGNIFQHDLSGDEKKKKRLNAGLNSSGFYAIAYNSTGKLLALTNSKGEINLLADIDCKCLKSGKKIQHVTFDKKHKGIARALAFSPGCRYLASGGLDGTIMLWNLKSKTAPEIVRQELILTITGKQKILSLVFDAGGEYMIFCDEKHLRICSTSPETFYDILCKRKKREFRKDEWKHYIGESIEQEGILICPPGKRE